MTGSDDHDREIPFEPEDTPDAGAEHTYFVADAANSELAEMRKVLPHQCGLATRGRRQAVGGDDGDPVSLAPCERPEIQRHPGRGRFRGGLTGDRGAGARTLPASYGRQDAGTS